MDDGDIFWPPPTLEPLTVCSARPVPPHSSGVWSARAVSVVFLDFPLPRLLVQLVLIFAFTQSLHSLLKLFRFPRTVSEISAGFVLGPTILGRISPRIFNRLFPPYEDVFLNTLSKIGFVLFVFLAGVRMGPGMIKKPGKKAWAVGVVSTVLPMAIAASVSDYLADKAGGYRTPSIKFLVASQTQSTFPVVARLLTDLGITNTEMGRLALASALIRELLRSSLDSLTTYVRVGETMSVDVQACFLTVVAVAGVILVSRPVFRWIIRRTPEGKPVKQTHVTLIMVSVFLTAVLFDSIGADYHFGPFLLGLCVPDGPPLGSTLDEKLDTLVSGLFAPLMVSYSVMHSDLPVTFQRDYQKLLCIVLLLSGVVRFASSFIPALFCKLPVKDATALSAILSAQGIVELAGFLNASEVETMDDQTYAAATVSVFVTALVVPQLVILVYDFSMKYSGYQKRSVLHSGTDAELRILACAHRPDDAMAVIKLVENSNPTREKPISVFALHLAEMIGRATPLIINHQLGQKGTASGVGSRSKEIIELFDHLEQQNSGAALTTEKFTAVSLPKFMHDDICLMAFDKSVSLIILPFHKKWNAQGKVVLDNKVWRSINKDVLQMAPCSVAILVDRRRVNRPSPSNYRVSVIFVGGDDDREALAFAKRVLNAPGVLLTVIRLYCDYDMEQHEQDWDSKLDDEVFRDLRIASSSSSDGIGNVRFREEKVRDGAEMARQVHSVEEFSDLVVVGRRHNEALPLFYGLMEGMEVTELGPIGDILAAGDTDNPVSVLVVQQQVHVTVM